MPFSDIQKDVRKVIREGRRHVLLLGQAGCGKTYATKDLKGITVSHALAHARVRDENGMTLMKFLGLNPLMCEEYDYDAHGLARDKTKSLLQYNGQTIFVEEAATIPLFLMQTLVWCLIRQPMANIQLVMSGDIYQLAPVRKYDEEKHNDFFMFDDCLMRWLHPKTFWFEKSERSTDPDLLGVLRAARHGHFDTITLRLLQSRMGHTVPEGCIHVVPTKAKAKEINTDYMKSLGNPIHVSVCADAPLEEMRLIEFCVGMRVIFTMNGKDYSKGTIATIQNIDMKKRKKEFRVTMETDRRQTLVVLPVAVCKNKKQLPFMCGGAIVVHRTQGLTLAEMALDLDGHFAPGQIYSALSRGTHLHKIFITGMDAQFLSRPGVLVDPRLNILEKKLREDSFTCQCGYICKY